MTSARFASACCSLLRLVGFEGTPLTVVQFIPTVVLIASVPLLVDHILASPALSGVISSHRIDVGTRDWKQASDHVPVMATFEV